MLRYQRLALVPLGAELNLALQLVAFVLIVVGLRFAILTHGAISSGKDGGNSERIHRNMMTFAVVVSGLGAVAWMVPNFLLGWFYESGGLGYGAGGYSSYLEIGGTYYAHWYLIPVMVIVGSLTSILGVYLVLRMRWSGFPEALKVKNFRRLMLTTWGLWAVNLFVGVLVFYFFAYLQTG